MLQVTENNDFVIFGDYVLRYFANLMQNSVIGLYKEILT